MYRFSASPSGRALRIPILAALLLALSVVVAACGSDDSSSTSAKSATGQSAASTTAAVTPANLRMMLDWVPGAVHSGIYQAKDSGMFDKEKLNVKVTKPPSATAPLTFTAAGKTDLAIAYEPDLVVSNDATAGKVKAVFALATKPLAGLWFGKNGGSSVADLKGKTVGWFGIPYEKPMLK